MLAVYVDRRHPAVDTRQVDRLVAIRSPCTFCVVGSLTSEDVVTDGRGSC